MKNNKPDPELIDEENPEWTAEDMKRARPAAEVLPKYIGQKATDELFVPGRGRPPKDDRDVNQIVRIDPDVLEAYQQEGKDWQTRINQVLRDNMPKHGR